LRRAYLKTSEYGGISSVRNLAILI